MRGEKEATEAGKREGSERMTRIKSRGNGKKYDEKNDVGNLMKITGRNMVK